MFQRILTELERTSLKKYLKKDGEREAVIRALATRARRYLPMIRSDLELLERLVQIYGPHYKSKAKK